MEMEDVAWQRRSAALVVAPVRSRKLAKVPFVELAEGRLDTAIVALPVSEPSLHEVALFTEDFVLVRPEADAGLPVPNRDRLREMRLLLLEEGHCFRDQALSFCNAQNLRPRELLDGSSLTTLVQMVGAGIGVTLIPEMAIAVETASARVAALPQVRREPAAPSAATVARPAAAEAVDSVALFTFARAAP